MLYRDMRTYGLLEDYYTEARRQGVIIFIRFDKDHPPLAESSSEGVQVTVKDHVLQSDVRPSDAIFWR